jgi:PAS domain S-box-containing protein
MPDKNPTQTDESLMTMLSRSSHLSLWNQDDLQSFMSLLAGRDTSEMSAVKAAVKTSPHEAKEVMLEEHLRQRELMILQQKAELEAFDRASKGEISAFERVRFSEHKFSVPPNTDIADCSTLVDDCTFPALTMNRENRVVHVNQLWLEACGYSREHVTGNTLTFLQGPMTDHKQLADFVRTCQSNEHCTVRIVNYRKDGAPLWNTIRCYPLKDGKYITVNHIEPMTPEECEQVQASMTGSSTSGSGSETQSSSSEGPSKTRKRNQRKNSSSPESAGNGSSTGSDTLSDGARQGIMHPSTEARKRSIASSNRAQQNVNDHSGSSPDCQQIEEHSTGSDSPENNPTTAPETCSNNAHKRVKLSQPSDLN